MSDTHGCRGSRRRFALPQFSMTLLVGGMLFSTIGCSSVPDVPDRAFDAMPGFGAKAKQRAFEQQVENDPFPTAGRVGL
ncbi:MAG TPA: hypothetical protein VE890_15485 [Thermoguttaceae bacterium]|nr:hypothetical protein [Thermoguttaceae bacterium]